MVEHAKRTVRRLLVAAAVLAGHFAAFFSGYYFGRVEGFLDGQRVRMEAADGLIETAAPLGER